mgnify:FL=1|uniref:Head to tail adaptor n=2 Tax=unclassified Caudoviricetes TaxID=2788787 RepID=A0A8S5MA65_9CAUD|nr:MAG TPA: head to tail adaptor [Siphoviridae sp. ctsDY37]DAF96016.1 MAG TPA: head to tail adaptor [Siphoviridae sp. cteLB10]
MDESNNEEVLNNEETSENNELDLTPIIESIVNIINQENTDEEFIEKILQRLISFGYTPSEADSWMITFCMQKVENHIKNSCNISEIPDELKEIEIDRICGEFLFSKKQTNQLNADNGFDVEMAIKQVQAGDTNVTFAVGEGSETLETKLNALISYLMNFGEGDFVCYRQIKW